MSDDDRMNRLERELAAAMREIDRLASSEAVRDCVYRVSRAIDRVDADLLLSSFHPGATIDYGKLFQGSVEDWAASAMKHQASQQQRHHLVGNIIVRIDGDEAVAESYALDRHKSPAGDGFKDLVLGARTLDRLARRDGEWRIVDRKKIMDWGRAISADAGVFENSPLEKAASDRRDASYALFDGLGGESGRMDQLESRASGAQGV